MTGTLVKRRVLLVLGMHRSGTSATARVVNLLGAKLGDNLIKPAADNPSGFWEHAEAVRINDVLLEGLGRSWYDMREMPQGWQDTDAARDARAQIESFVQKDFQDGSLWAIKDPRICLTAPLWIRSLQDLGYDVDCLFVVRDPREVVESLHVRNHWTRAPLYLMWVQYLMEAFAGTAGVRRSVISYGELLEDWRQTMRRVAVELNLSWPVGISDASDEVDAFLSKGRRHHVAKPMMAGAVDDMPEFVDRLYHICLSISRGESTWTPMAELYKSYKSVAALYAEHVDQLLRFRWKAEADAQVAEAANVASETRLGELERQFIDLSSRAIDLGEKLAAAVSEMQAMSTRHDAVQAQIEQQRAVVNEKESALRLLACKVAEQDSRMEDLFGEVAERDSRIQDLFGEVAERDSRIEDLFGEVAERDSRIEDLVSEVAERDGRIEDLVGEVAQRDSQVEDLSSEVLDGKVLLQGLLTSTSWRVTAPMRWMRRALMPRQWRASIGRFVKSVYVWVPLSVSRKLAIKGVLFSTFAPLLRTTTSYRAWQAFEAHRGRGSVPRRSQQTKVQKEQPKVSTEAPTANAARVLEVLNSSAGKVANDHVVMDEMPVDLSRIDVRAVAFYLPQFHPIPENDAWWGRGFTEWTNVSKAVPQFVGHYQPRLPGELGYYDLRVVDVMRRQVELAKHYGLQGFCFHYYWFGGRRLLEKPLQQFLDNKDIDFPFCICWANENWSRRWDGLDQDVLMAQQHSPEDDIAFITSLEPLLRDPRYIRIDGRPLVVLYRPSILPDAVATQQRWRDHCRKVGIGEIFLAMVQFDVEDPRTFGFDVAIEFPPHKLASGLAPINHELQIVNPEYSGYVIDYGSVIERAREHAASGFDMIRGVFPSWDNEARKPGRGYTFANATPARYREWLDLAIDYARQHPVAGERLVFINAWNEWAEGAYLEPDRRYGYAYLQQTRNALLNKSSMHPFKGRRVAIISHDANPHGAQYLALNLARELKNGLGIQVDLLLMSGGQLLSAFAEAGHVHDLSDMLPTEVDALLSGLRKDGVELVVANTAVSGNVTHSIAAAGLRVITLVHELPKLIRDYKLESAVRDLVKYSYKVVLPSDAVSSGLEHFVDGELLSSKSVIRPQGLFTRSKYRGAKNHADVRSNLRAKLGLPSDARIVLAVGYADRRKGIDLLLNVAAICCNDDPLVHFVWVGHTDTSMDSENAAAIAKGALQSRFHFVGMDFETDDYYAGADLYALPSREDPFPSVVLESLSVGTPVVAFAGTGGGADLVARSGGVVVPAFDIVKYAETITGLLGDDAERRRLGKIGIAVVDAEFSFRSYVMDLLCYGGMQVPRVSVVVPNFNYAHYLPERLASIARQTVPVYEIIVLDDGSDDESLDTIQRLRHSMHPEPRIIVNAVNSGSVFRQWQRGSELAHGDFVWIAEADDLAKPDFLERLLPDMVADPEVVLGYCQSEAIDEDGTLVMQDYLEYTDDLSVERWANSYVVDGASEVEAALSIKNTIPNVSAVLFRRQPLLDVMNGQLDEIARYKVAGDWFVYLQLLRAGKICYSAHVGNCHRRHRGSVTLGTAAERHYREVTELQELARATFAVSEPSIRSAQRYRAQVAEHLGIATNKVAGE